MIAAQMHSYIAGVLVLADHPESRLGNFIGDRPPPLPQRRQAVPLPGCQQGGSRILRGTRRAEGREKRPRFGVRVCAS